jgi:Protein of unknown function (DUF1524)
MVWRRWAALAAMLVSAAAVGVAGAPSAAAASVSMALRSAVSGLPVAAEVRTGYERSKFPLWVDADSDGCDTRREVLIAEATTAPAVGSGCALTGGRWRSYYDGASWTDPADLDIDHLVPLAEAWDSGARGWTTAQRQAYANDLGDARDLVAVTDNVNQAKGDRDPAEWLPPLAGATCRYVAEWVAVKLRWRLTVDSTEKAALADLAAGCANVTITVTRAI